MTWVLRKLTLQAIFVLLRSQLESLEAYWEFDCFWRRSAWNYGNLVSALQVLKLCLLKILISNQFMQRPKLGIHWKRVWASQFPLVMFLKKKKKKISISEGPFNKEIGSQNFYCNLQPTTSPCRYRLQLLFKQR